MLDNILSLDGSVMPTSRVDVLIYAHDGRGLGHVSRAVALCLALRRLSPNLRVVLITGSEYVPTLAGFEHLEWIKLPAYKNIMIGGVARGIGGTSQLSYEEIREVRKYMILSIFLTLRPRAVVVDHYPEGKEGELQPLFNTPLSSKVSWFLGLRSFPGVGSRIWNCDTSVLVRNRFSHVLWYGDSKVACHDIYNNLKKHFAPINVVETGYVSRARELATIEAPPKGGFWAGVAAFTWCSNDSIQVLNSLSHALSSLTKEIMHWRVTIGSGATDQCSQALGVLRKSGLCDISPPDAAFLWNLRNCRVSVLCGGYNSLTDIIWSQTPSVVVVRRSSDLEQEKHATALAEYVSGKISLISEKDACNPSLLRKAIQKQLTKKRLNHPPISLNGAEIAARVVMENL